MKDVYLFLTITKDLSIDITKSRCKPPTAVKVFVNVGVTLTSLAGIVNTAVVNDELLDFTTFCEASLTVTPLNMKPLLGVAVKVITSFVIAESLLLTTVPPVVELIATANLTSFTVKSRPEEEYPDPSDLKLSVMVLPWLIILSSELFDGPSNTVQPVFADTSAVAEVLEPSKTLRLSFALQV